MEVKFRVIQKAQPGVPGGGVKKYYASHDSKVEINLEDLTTLIEKECTVNGADILAVLYALVDVSVFSLSEGKIVRLGQLGSLRLTLKSKGELTADEVDVDSIKGTNIVFTPGNKLKTMQKNLKFKKA